MFLTDPAVAAVSQRHRPMKSIVGMSAAALIVLLQLAAVAAWPSEAELHLAPAEGPAFGDARPA